MSTAAPVIEAITPIAAVVPLSDLYPSPTNPRKHFDGIEELAASLTEKGVDIPLIVRTRESSQGRLEVVDGERRYRAAQYAGLQFVPVILRDHLADADVLALQLENAMQRRDLTPLEEARGIKALIKSAKQTPAEIAKSLSRSEWFVAERLRLLDLLPALQQLLDQGRITVAHADVLSKLTKDDQTRAVHPGDISKHWGREGDPGGLWDRETRTLDLRDDGDEDTKALARDPYVGLKPVSVKELQGWVGRHVRFDVVEMAKAAPLEFERVKAQVDTAAAKPGRGKKVIHITHEYHLADDVKDPSQRVYGPRSWKRADDTIGTSTDGKGKKIDSKTCEHSVLGLVVVGPEYSRAFPVCVARDKCKVHWAVEIREKEKRDKLRASGQGDKANKREQKERDSWEAQEARRAEERKAAGVLFRRVYPQLETAILAAIPAATSHAAVAFLWDCIDRGGRLPATVVTVDDLLNHLVLGDLESEKPPAKDPAYHSLGDNQLRLTRVATVLGIDVKPLVEAAKRAIAEEAKAATSALSTTAGGSSPTR